MTPLRPNNRKLAISLAPALLLAGTLAALTPAVPRAYLDDADGNRIADVIDAEIRRARQSSPPAEAARASRQPIDVVFIFNDRLRGDNRRRIEHRGGRIVAEESILLYAFHAEVPIGEIAQLARELHGLVLVAEPEDFAARFALVSAQGDPRWIPSRNAEEISVSIAESRISPPGIAFVRANHDGLPSATHLARIEALRSFGLFVPPSWMDDEWHDAIEQSMQHAAWQELERITLLDQAVLLANLQETEQLTRLLDALEAPVKEEHTFTSSHDEWRIATSSEPAWIARLAPSATGAVRVAIHPVAQLRYDETQVPAPVFETTITPGSQARVDLAELDGHAYFILVEGQGEMQLVPWRDEPAVTGVVPSVEDLFPETTPTPAPREATEPLRRDSVPVAHLRMETDGVAQAEVQPQVANTSAPESNAFQIANIRVANDNDYLHLHIAASLPATSDSVPVAMWILYDHHRVRGVNPLTDNGMRGPVAATAGLDGTVLEPFFEADGMLFLENATTTRRDRYKLWWVNYAGENEALLAEFSMTDPGPAIISEQAPIGFRAGFNNSAGFMVPRDADRAATGLELRLPLSMLGLDAPLYPQLRPQQIRLMVAGGHGETGAWSNQILGPINGPRVLGGGMGMQKPNFRTKITGDGETTFSGTQTMEFTIRFAPRGGTE